MFDTIDDLSKALAKIALVEEEVRLLKAVSFLCYFAFS
jgi:hypothetical protein